MNPIDPRLLSAISKVRGKRARIVLDHILQHGFVTTEDLEARYKHPPRAIGDVRDAGIPLVMYRVPNSDGRSIAAYRLGDPADIRDHTLGGRRTYSKALHRQLAYANGGRCYVCMTKYEPRYLQVDHRVPYRIAGEPAGDDQVNEFMLLCASCQRKKSWSCENCPNWITREREICEGCFWVRPDNYVHIATRPERRVELVFSGAETVLYDELQKTASAKAVPVGELIKHRLNRGER